MILSMTGYANAAAEMAGVTLSVEIRSVNHRYLDIQIRMPEELRSFEGMVRENISSRLQRGKVECRFNLDARNYQSGARLNHDLLLQLAAWNRQVQTSIPGSASLSVADVLGWNGILETAQDNSEELRERLFDLLGRTLGEFSESRAREGARLKEFLLQRVEQIEVLRNAVLPHVPGAIAAYEQKLTTRLRDAIQIADDERIRQEVVMFASKIDVDEELSRLSSHLVELRRILTQGGAAGKRLDFLMQELNREANTLGAKSVDAEVSRSAMEMKILIEQMREQIQNIE